MRRGGGRELRGGRRGAGVGGGSSFARRGSGLIGRERGLGGDLTQIQRGPQR
jgi:hypothetical protein